MIKKQLTLFPRALLLIRTGSAEHYCWLAGCAISQGMRLKYSEGLIKEGRAIAGKDERGMFAAFGLPCPAPPERKIVDGKPVWMKNSLETPKYRSENRF